MSELVSRAGSAPPVAPANATQKHRVVIVGGGFGGLYAAKSLADAAVDIVLVDRRNFHLFQPLLYQVATGAIGAGDMATPLRLILKRQANTTVLLGEARTIDPEERTVELADGGRLPYDTLVVATGAHHDYFGHPEWEPLAPGLKTLEDASEIRRRILLAYEAAEREADDAVREALMTFLVVGGGPTGVELAGALGEISRETLPPEFRRISPERARIVLLEGLDRILPSYRPSLSGKAARELERRGVEVSTNTLVTAIDEEGVTARRNGEEVRIPSRTILWAAGVRASSFGRTVGEVTGTPLDRAGRLSVEPDLTLPGLADIFVIGDLAALQGPDGKQLPGVAPVAIQQGRYVARSIAARLAGRTRPAPPFRYRDKGSVATIGRGAGVADLRWIRLDGMLAWFAWLFVHLWYLIGFERRIIVITQWVWNFFTAGRGTRLITGESVRLSIKRPR